MSKFQGGVGEPLPWVFDLGEPGCALPTSILKMKTWFNEKVNLTRMQYKKVINKECDNFFVPRLCLGTRRTVAEPGSEGKSYFFVFHPSDAYGAAALWRLYWIALQVTPAPYIRYPNQGL
ncbi:MAG: hypothetical protein J7L16_09640 [Deltaproteobacteria bacterium]|nr:hypothetical protein [Deltaproteobacteria bacterium]